MVKNHCFRFTDNIIVISMLIVVIRIQPSLSFILKPPSLLSSLRQPQLLPPAIIGQGQGQYHYHASLSKFNSKKGNEEEEQIEIDEETMLRFQGVGRLYEQQQQPSQPSSSTESYTEIINRLQKSTVAIIGIGGVGSWAAESVCRSGVGNIILIDMDDVCISNTNRQLHATSSTVGQLKINVMKDRLLDINPKCNVTLIHDFITLDNVFDIVEGFQSDCQYDDDDDDDGSTDTGIDIDTGTGAGTDGHSNGGNNGVDVIIDAIDGHLEKAALIAAACIKDIPIVTCGGAAGRIDPTQIVCDDLSESIECKLLFWTKKKLRNHYRLFPKSDGKTKKNRSKRGRRWRIPAIYSTEQQKKVTEEQNASSSSFRKCDGALGTACFVTGTYGMIAASQAVAMITKEKVVKPRVIRSSIDYWNKMHDESKKQKVDEIDKQPNMLDGMEILNLKSS